MAETRNTNTGRGSASRNNGADAVTARRQANAAIIAVIALVAIGALAYAAYERYDDDAAMRTANTEPAYNADTAALNNNPNNINRVGTSASGQVMDNTGSRANLNDRSADDADTVTTGMNTATGTGTMDEDDTDTATEGGNL